MYRQSTIGKWKFNSNNYGNEGIYIISLRQNGWSIRALRVTTLRYCSSISCRHIHHPNLGRIAVDLGTVSRFLCLAPLTRMQESVCYVRLSKIGFNELRNQDQPAQESALSGSVGLETGDYEASGGRFPITDSHTLPTHTDKLQM